MTAELTLKIPVKPRTVVRAPGARIPRATLERVAPYLEATFAFMDSPIFKQKNIEKELFTFDQEPSLPRTRWYQPTREDTEGAVTGAPQLMSTAEERLMFLR